MKFRMNKLYQTSDFSTIPVIPGVRVWPGTIEAYDKTCQIWYNEFTNPGYPQWYDCNWGGERKDHVTPIELEDAEPLKAVANGDYSGYVFGIFKDKPLFG